MARRAFVWVAVLLASVARADVNIGDKCPDADGCVCKIIWRFPDRALVECDDDCCPPPPGPPCRSCQCRSACRNALAGCKASASTPDPFSPSLVGRKAKKACSRQVMKRCLRQRPISGCPAANVAIAAVARLTSIDGHVPSAGHDFLRVDVDLNQFASRFETIAFLLRTSGGDAAPVDPAALGGFDLDHYCSGILQRTRNRCRLVFEVPSSQPAGGIPLAYRGGSSDALFVSTLADGQVTVAVPDAARPPEPSIVLTPTSAQIGPLYGAPGYRYEACLDFVVQARECAALADVTSLTDTLELSFACGHTGTRLIFADCAGTNVPAGGALACYACFGIEEGARDAGRASLYAQPSPYVARSAVVDLPWGTEGKITPRRASVCPASPTPLTCP